MNKRIIKKSSPIKVKIDNNIKESYDLLNKINYIQNIKDNKPFLMVKVINFKYVLISQTYYFSFFISLFVFLNLNFLHF